MYESWDSMLSLRCIEMSTMQAKFFLFFKKLMKHNDCKYVSLGFLKFQHALLYYLKEKYYGRCV